MSCWHAEADGGQDDPMGRGRPQNVLPGERGHHVMDIDKAAAHQKLRGELQFSDTCLMPSLLVLLLGVVWGDKGNLNLLETRLSCELECHEVNSVCIMETSS